MKKAIKLFFLSALFFTVIGTAQTKVKGNGNVVSEKRNVANYDEINVSGDFDINLVSGTEGAITIEGESNVIPYVKVVVSDNVLKIFSENKVNISTKKGIVVTVPFEQISALSLSGSGDILTENTIVAPVFKAKLSGSGDLTLDLKSSDLEVGLSGSGDISLKGTADNFVSKTSGSGDIDAIDLVAKKATVSISGSGDVKVNCSENLYARVSGSGDIEYKGEPQIKDTKVSGSGDISKI